MAYFKTSSYSNYNNHLVKSFTTASQGIILLKVYIEKKTSLYLLCDDYVLSIADVTSVSTFLCTRKLGPEEVSVSLIAV